MAEMKGSLFIYIVGLAYLPQARVPQAATIILAPLWVEAMTDLITSDIKTLCSSSEGHEPNQLFVVTQPSTWRLSASQSENGPVVTGPLEAWLQVGIRQRSQQPQQKHPTAILFIPGRSGGPRP